MGTCRAALSVYRTGAPKTAGAAASLAVGTHPPTFLWAFSERRVSSSRDNTCLGPEKYCPTVKRVEFQRFTSGYGYLSSVE